MTVVMETSAVQMLREDVTQFVLNGWTHPKWLKVPTVTQLKK